MAEPEAWRADVSRLFRGQRGADATWLANLNARYPWRNVVAHIRLPDAREIVLKYHTSRDDLQREWAAARFLAEANAPPLAPECLGLDAQRMVLAYARLAGPELTAVLDGPAARSAWGAAVTSLAALHQWAATRHERWMALMPADRSASRLAAYDLPVEALLRPFHAVGMATPELGTAIERARQAVAAPGSWLAFTHGDLQTRHLLWTAAGLRIVDWEGAGLRHRLYDLACLLDKPTAHGRRLPQTAHDGAINHYARLCGLDAAAVRAELIPVLAYERLIAVAEDYPTQPALSRAALEGLIALTAPAAAYAAIGHGAGRLLETLPEDAVPFFAGFGDR